MIGRFVYVRSYLARADAAELDPVELKLASRTYETQRCAVYSALSEMPGRIIGAGRSSRSTLEGEN